MAEAWKRDANRHISVIFFKEHVRISGRKGTNTLNANNCLIASLNRGKTKAIVANRNRLRLILKGSFFMKLPIDTVAIAQEKKTTAWKLSILSKFPKKYNININPGS